MAEEDVMVELHGEGEGMWRKEHAKGGCEDTGRSEGKRRDEDERLDDLNNRNDNDNIID